MAFQDRVARYIDRLPTGTGWVLSMFVFSRLLIVALIFLTQLMLPRGPYVEVTRIAEHGGGLLDVLTQWDGVWYRQIAQAGYESGLAGAPPLRAAFFPLYPILIRVLASLGVNYQLASVLISNAALIGAAILLYAIVQIEYHDKKISRLSVVFLLFSPCTFYFSAGLTEGTFLFLAIAAFAAAIKERWLLASLAGMALSATRPTGFLILFPLLVEYFRQWWQHGRNPRNLVGIFWLGLVPMGLGLYALFCYNALGDAFAYAHVQYSPAWDRQFTLPWQTFLHPKNSLPPEILFHRIGVIVVLLVIVAGAWLHIRLSYLVYAALTFVFPLCWTTLNSIFRQHAVIFPLYLTLALIAHRYRWTCPCLLAACAAAMSLFIAIWANAYGLA